MAILRILIEADKQEGATKQAMLYPKQGFLPLFAFLERQLSFPLRLRFPTNFLLY